ncbi:hypothetical protein PoB_001045100 [Plakobranchus ocellatus]|uniref:Uncharacterized protein n=1 Tax=Plakobranchus ocellatus TaxID=259542 RepID=A0AAV3Y9K5_9GAST|nr:hypothetical protein PoB_001045100 [Plakobranchus ocellatus]
MARTLQVGHYSPSSPQSRPCTLRLSSISVFGPLKRHLGGKKIEDEDELIGEVRDRFSKLDANFFTQGAEIQGNQRENLNRRHAIRPAPELQPGDPLYIKDLDRPGSVIRRHPNPYIIGIGQGTIHHRCKYVVATSTPVQPEEAPIVPEASLASSKRASRDSPVTTTSVRPKAQSTPRSSEHLQVTRCARAVIPSKRLDL